MSASDPTADSPESTGPSHADAPGPPADDGRPRIPTPEEAAEFHPATDLFVAFLDTISESTLGRPLRPRLKLSPVGLLRGEIDVVKIELPAYAVAGLIVDRFVLRGERVRIVPGIPPKLVAEPAGFRAVVSQANIDRWTKDLRLPFRLRLTEAGVVTTAGLGGIRMTEVVTMPDIAGGFLRLQPKRVSLLGMPAPLVRFLRGYLPLPPLPRGAQLESVVPSDGELTLTFHMDRFEQALTPDVRKRLRQVLNLPLPGLR